MKVLLGCDVDPVLPAFLARPPAEDIWACLNLLDNLIESLGSRLPRVTWLIRSDESVRFSSGRFDSGFVVRESFWRSLLEQGHEIGWHMHLTSLDRSRGCFGFDREPSWLQLAHATLADHVPIAATRTGWDYGSNKLLRKLDALGIRVDFSALPGNIAWQHAGPDTVCVDWRRCPDSPYHPKNDDYQRPGQLRLLEIPIAQFRNSKMGMIRRAAWRLRHGCSSFAGLGKRTKLLTQKWNGLPTSVSPIWAFYFHPEDLVGDGLPHFVENVGRLRALPGVEFVTAAALAASEALHDECRKTQ